MIARDNQNFRLQGNAQGFDSDLRACCKRVFVKCKTGFDSFNIVGQYTFEGMTRIEKIEIKKLR